MTGGWARTLSGSLYLAWCYLRTHLLKTTILVFSITIILYLPFGLRVLVTHHNLARAPDYAPEQVLPGHRRYLAAFSGMGVDLILGGHLHRSYLASSLDVFPQPAGVPAMTIVHTGTTTSRRGRARERGQNSLNLIRVSNNEITVAPHHLERESGAFRPSGSYSWPRKGARRE